MDKTEEEQHEILEYCQKAADLDQLKTCLVDFCNLDPLCAQEFLSIYYELMHVTLELHFTFVSVVVWIFRGFKKLYTSSGTHVTSLTSIPFNFCTSISNIL